VQRPAMTGLRLLMNVGLATTRLRSLVHVGVTGRQWLLPWMSILLMVAAMTYAMIEAFNGSWATPYWWPAVAIASPAAATTSPSGQSADLGPSVTPLRCAPIGAGYMDSSIVAESRKIDCGWAP
jgi:hypothetical protein